MNYYSLTIHTITIKFSFENDIQILLNSQVYNRIRQPYRCEHQIGRLRIYEITIYQSITTGQLSVFEQHILEDLPKILLLYVFITILFNLFCSFKPVVHYYLSGRISIAGHIPIVLILIGQVRSCQQSLLGHLSTVYRNHLFTII